MDKPIYYSKIEFIEYSRFGAEQSSLLLDLNNKEISYQKFDYIRKMPSAVRTVNIEFQGKLLKQIEHHYPMIKIANGKNGFKPQMIKDNNRERLVSYSYGHKLSEDEYQNILPSCNAREFELFRGRKMSMKDTGFIGYRDEIDIYFVGITDSYIPLLYLPMSYYYDENNIWPSEKLYRYIINTFFNKPEFKQHRIEYGGCSLFG